MALPALLALVGAGLSAYQGSKDGKKADKMNQAALDQAKMEYQQLAPLRRQGMQALGQIEAPMDLGQLGHNAANPFAAARGPAPSTASYGDWGRFTTAPEDVDMALSGVTPEELQFMEDASGATYLGRSKGKQRFGGTGSGQQYTNQDRERANAIRSRVQSNLGYTGTTADTLMRGRGIQPLRGRTPTDLTPRYDGLQPLGGR